MNKKWQIYETNEEEVKKVKKPKSKTKANENQMSIFDLLGDEGGTNA